MRSPRRSSVLALLGVAAVAAASLPLIAFGVDGLQAPDLRADPVENVEGPNVYDDTEGGLGDGSLLVRFDGFVTNVGQGPLEVSGNPQIPGSVRQWARTSSLSPPTVAKGTPEVRFESADSHNHWHLMRAMRYSLWNLQKTAQVAPSQKVGFCLYDIEPASGAQTQDPKTYTADVTRFCEHVDWGGGGAAATSLRMGTSPGWRDIYDKALAYQWIDVSNTSPGTYLVGSEADPDNTLWEGGGAAEVNAPAFASQKVTVPGWVAQPVQMTQTAAPQGVTLAAVKFGTQSDANLRYRIVSGPSHGSVNVPVGANFGAGQTLVYTPSPGYTGADTFTYVALSSASPFPTSPPVAAVSIAGATPSITLSGAPASMVAGTSVQLSAGLSNLSGGVTWSASGGTISASGLYTTPASPPPGGSVVVRASATSNPSVAAEVTIGVTPAPATTARPDVGGRLTAGRALLSRVKVTRINRRLIVGKVALGRLSGRVTITATLGRRIVGRCVARRVGARRTFTCKMKLRRAYPLKRVRVTAKFVSAKGKKTAVRRTRAVR